eukprot:1154801-Pelagomonas_calceolata.AAC.1
MQGLRLNYKAQSTHTYKLSLAAITQTMQCPRPRLVAGLALTPCPTPFPPCPCSQALRAHAGGRDAGECQCGSGGKLGDANELCQQGRAGWGTHHWGLRRSRRGPSVWLPHWGHPGKGEVGHRWVGQHLHLGLL